MFEDEAFLRSMRRASAAVALAGLGVAALWGLAMVALRDVLGAPVVPFELGAVLGSLGNRIMGAEGGQGFKIWWWILLAVVPIASLGAHELVHAFFFKQYAPPGTRVSFGSNAGMGMLYASAEGVLYTRGQYLVIALAVHAFFFKQYAPPGTRVSFGSNAGMGMLYASAEGVLYTRGQYLVIALAPSIVVSLLIIALGMGLKWPLWTFIVATAHLVGCTGDWGYARAIVADPAIAWCEDTSYGVAFFGEDRPGGFTVVEGGRRS